VSETLGLAAVVRSQERGAAAGIAAVCSAHLLLLDEALAAGVADGAAVLVESTCNQVNPDGGYTGQTPADFAELLRGRGGAGSPSAADWRRPPDRTWRGDPRRGDGQARELSAACPRRQRSCTGREHAIDDDPGCRARVAGDRSAPRTRAPPPRRRGATRPGSAAAYVIGTDAPPEATGGRSPAGRPPAELERTLIRAPGVRRAGLEDA
jgi:D-tagatose-1,6-bisphosphate aldolase subunit GatZ/KbaZ